MTYKLIPLILLLAPLTGCPKSGGGTGGGAAPSPQAQQEAKTLFASRCGVCHGERGAGDGPGAAALNPKPRNFQDKGWQGSITDSQIEDIIKKGGGAVGKSAAMPPNPDLADKAEVVAALRFHIRSLAQ